MNEDREISHETRRWLLMILVCIAFAGSSFVTTGIEVANGAVAKYFKRKEDEIAFLGSLEFLVAAIGLMVTALVGRNANLRRLSIAAIGFLFIGAAAAAVGFMERNSYWLIVLSFAVIGLSFGLLLILPPFLVDLWMTADLNSFVFGMASLFSYVGGAAAVLAYHHMNNDTIAEFKDGHWFTAEFGVRRSYVAGFGAFSLLAFGSVVLICLCMDNRVRLPQDDMEIITSKESTTRSPECCGLPCLKRILHPLSKLNLVLLMVTNILLSPLHAHSFLVMPGLMQSAFPKATIVGYISSSGLFAGAVGCGLAIFALKKFQNTKAIALTGSILAAVDGVGLFLSYKFRVFAAAAFCQVLLTLCGGYLFVSILELLVFSNKNSDRTTVTSLHFAFFNFGMFAFESLGFYFSVAKTPNSYIMMMMIAHLIIPFLLLLTKVKNENLEEDDLRMATVATEETRLVGDSKS